MCGRSNIEFNGKNINIFLGYYSRFLSIENIEYNPDNDNLNDRKKITKELSKYTKSDIINMLLDLVDNGEEG